MKHLCTVALAVGAAVWSATSFQKIVGGPDFERGVFVSPTSDGGYVAVGVTTSYGQGNEDVFLVKTDARGELLWTRALGGAEDDNGWSVFEQAGNLVVVGFTNSFGAGDFDCYLVATNSEGEMIWSRTFGGEGKDRCWGFVAMHDGGFALIGETTSFGSGADDCYLIRTDDSGNELWSRTFGGEDGDRCFSIASARDGGFVLAGQTYSEGAGDRDAYVIKTDDSGNLQWSKTFGGPASDVGHSVAPIADGQFIVTGYATSLVLAEYDPYLIKINADGHVAWTQVIPMKGANRTLTGEQSADGGFILGGFSEYRSDGARAALLVKTDTVGQLVWHRDLFVTTTGTSVGYTVRATRDGGAVLTGHTTEESAGNVDLFIVKTDNQGQ